MWTVAFQQSTCRAIGRCKHLQTGQVTEGGGRSSCGNVGGSYHSYQCWYRSHSLHMSFHQLAYDLGWVLLNCVYEHYAINCIRHSINCLSPECWSCLLITITWPRDTRGCINKGPVTLLLLEQLAPASPDGMLTLGMLTVYYFLLVKYDTCTCCRIMKLAG